LLAFGLFTLIYLFFFDFLKLSFPILRVVCFFAVFMFIAEVLEYHEINYSDLEGKNLSFSNNDIV
jgi:hypothetical protein